MTIADIYEDGEHIQLWKDEETYDLRILCATIGIDVSVEEQVFRELNEALQKYLQYKKGESV